MKGIELLKKPVFWLILLLALVWLAVWQLPDNKLHLVFCEVGQGDASLISYRSNQVLIDGGPDNKVLNCLAENMPFWDRTIEMVVLTHPQADHLTGLIDVAERYNVKQFVVNSIVNDTASFWEFYQAVLAERAQVYSPKAGDKIRLGPIQFLVLWPRERLGDRRVWRKEIHLGGVEVVASPPSEVLGAATYSGSLNETSIVLKLSFGNFDALLTGDTSSDIENQLELDFDQVEILKVAHHGSKYSTSEEFLAKIKPALAVISVGKNSFGHPTEEVLKRLSNQAIKLSRTDLDGEIEVVSDGGKWYTRYTQAK